MRKNNRVLNTTANKVTFFSYLSKHYDRHRCQNHGDYLEPGARGATDLRRPLFYPRYPLRAGAAFQGHATFAVCRKGRYGEGHLLLRGLLHGPFRANRHGQHRRRGDRHRHRRPGCGLLDVVHRLLRRSDGLHGIDPGAEIQIPPRKRLPRRSFQLYRGGTETEMARCSLRHCRRRRVRTLPDDRAGQRSRDRHEQRFRRGYRLGGPGARRHPRHRHIRRPQEHLPRVRHHHALHGPRLYPHRHHRHRLQHFGGSARTRHHFPGGFRLRRGGRRPHWHDHHDGRQARPLLQ